MLQTGDLIAARYRIEKRLGQGGFATVYEATHLGTERTVALKVLGAHAMGTSDTLEKFQLEAKVSARVKNQHIVEVHDAGFDEARQCAFLVMELLQGETLAERLRRCGRLAPDTTLALLRELADGLDAAHGYRNPSGQLTPIVHRDLKPENLFVHRRHDGSELLKILDFGIAKVIGQTSLQLSLSVRGTPPFMAPEQINPAPTSPQTDVWALGLITHLMLTGQHYWRALERPECGPVELFAEILTHERESARTRGGASELPPEYDAWLLRCIEPLPERRFPSAGAAVDALRRAFERPAPERRRASATLLEQPLPVRTARFGPEKAPSPVTFGSLPSVAREGSADRSVRPRRGAVWARTVGIGALALVSAALLTWILSEPRSIAESAQPMAPRISAASNALEPSREPPGPDPDAVRASAEASTPRAAAREPVIAPVVAPPEEATPAQTGGAPSSPPSRARDGAAQSSASMRANPERRTRSTPPGSSASGQPPAPSPGVDPYNIAPNELVRRQTGSRPAPQKEPAAAKKPIDPYDIAPDAIETAPR